LSGSKTKEKKTLYFDRPHCYLRLSIPHFEVLGEMKNILVLSLMATSVSSIVELCKC